MKKLLFIFAASILGMVACNDERVETTKLEQGMNAISAAPGHWIYVSCDGSSGYGCYELDTVTVLGGLKTALDDAMIAGPTAIKDLFLQSEYIDLVAGTGSGNVDFLQSGDAYLNLIFEDESTVAYYVGDVPILDEFNALFSFSVKK